MAISKEKWLEVQGYYEAGLSLAKIKDKTGVDRSTISKKAKNQQWQHGRNTDYIEAKELIVEKKSTENQHLLNCADIVADDNIRRKNLIFGNAELMASKVPDILESFTKKDKDEETGEVTSEFLMPSKDFKELAEANDKLSITLGVNDRHANSKVEVNTQNNNHSNSEISITRLKQSND